MKSAILKQNGPLEIRLSVTVSDGSFEGSLSCPVSGGPAEFKKVAGTWMQMLHQALMLTQGAAPKEAESETGAAK